MLTLASCPWLFYWLLSLNTPERERSSPKSEISLVVFSLMSPSGSQSLKQVSPRFHPPRSGFPGLPCIPFDADILTLDGGPRMPASGPHEQDDIEVLTKQMALLPGTFQRIVTSPLQGAIV